VIEMNRILLSSWNYAWRMTITTYGIFLIRPIIEIFNNSTLGFLLYIAVFSIPVFIGILIFFFLTMFILFYIYKFFRIKNIFYKVLISIGLLCICIFLYIYAIMHYFNPLGTTVNFFQDGILNHSIIGWVFSIYLIIKNKYIIN
jgi:signal transduction histidine kinase